MALEISQILNSTPGSNVDQFSRLTKNLVEAASAATAIDDGQPPEKHGSLALLQDSGLATQYNNILRNQITINGYKIAATNADSTLTKELQGLNSLRAIITKFRGDTANLSTAATAAITAGPTALASIQALLNTSIDNGIYLFGGLNNNVAPCGDLTITNIDVNGNITTNYTDAAPDIKTISIADDHQISVGVYAGDPAFAQAIGAINQWVAGNVAEAEDSLNQAASRLDQLIIQNGTAANDIKDASKYNDEVLVQIDKDLSSTFTLGITEAATNFKSALEVLLASYKFTTALNNAFERFIQSI